MAIGPFHIWAPPGGSARINESPYYKHFLGCIKQFIDSCPSFARVNVLNDGNIEIHDRGQLLYRGPIENCDTRIGAIVFKLSDEQINMLIALRVMDS